MSSPHIYSSSIGLLFVCRNHSALTQTRVWQCPVSPPLRDSRLGGGAPLFLPFFSPNIWKYEWMVANWNRTEGKKVNDGRLYSAQLSSTLLHGVGTSRPPWPPGSLSLLNRTFPEKKAPIFARACTSPLCSRFPARLPSTDPPAGSSICCSGKWDSPVPGLPSPH